MSASSAMTQKSAKTSSSHTIDIRFDSRVPGKFCKWKVAPRSQVSPGMDLLAYEVGSKSERLRCAVRGRITWLKTFKKGDTIMHGSLIAKMIGDKGSGSSSASSESRKRTRPDRDESSVPAANKKLKHAQSTPAFLPSHSDDTSEAPNPPPFSDSPKEEDDLDAPVSPIWEDPNEPEPQVANGRLVLGTHPLVLLQQRKLTLLVDLDETVVHATADYVDIQNIPHVFSFKSDTSDNRWYHVRVRPYAHEFLNDISALFELHVCTFGNRSYAQQVAAHLDPTGKLFGNRILSKEDCIQNASKTANLKVLFPDGDQLVCIMDDREDVWDHALNMIHVKPYRYFETKAFSTANTPFSSYASDFSPTRSILDTDVYLLRLRDTLMRVHKEFYRRHDELVEERAEALGVVPQLNLGDITRLSVLMPVLKRKILQGVNLVLSGIIPTNVPPYKCYAYYTAVSFGANVQNAVMDPTLPGGTTHVVATKTGTSKVNQAVQHIGKVHILRPEWLFDCFERWERLPEQNYTLIAPPSPAASNGLESEYNGVDAPFQQYEPQNIEVLID